MNRLDARLMDVLEPVRDVAVAEILESMARSLDRGLDVRPEPEWRTPQGGIVREGRLALPRRGDLLVQRAGAPDLTRQLRSGTTLPFEPVTLVEPSGFVCVIAPFRWDAAAVSVEAGALEAEPSWTPLRRWFLEWFQSRFSDEAPDLDGALHSLAGPETTPYGWRFEVDFGSAPVETLSDMIGAFAETGVARIRIGEAG
ncbi:MAG: hypothetical protein ACFBWO_10310 [Paracoccaceae bacterium]